MIAITEETVADVAAREVLLDRAFGPCRFLKTSERLREGRLPAAGLALAARDGSRLVGTVRLWNIAAGPNRPALLLGPLAVDPLRRSRGLGSRLMRGALALAATAGHGAVLLVGDAPYYARFGFSADATQALWLPGPYERGRFLALELVPDALAGARGLVAPTGERVPVPDLASLVAAAAADVALSLAA